MGGQRTELKGYFHRESTQGESCKTVLDLTQLGEKAARQKNTSPLIRKSYSPFFWVTVKKGVADDGGNDDE